MTPLALRLIGLYDGKSYTHFADVRSFLNHACRKEHSGRWYYAHAGGLFDMVFILEYLVDNPRPGVSIQCCLSGSSAIIVKIKRGDSSWYFVDSWRLIASPLRKIAEMMGQKKGGAANSTDLFYAPLPELIAYNEQDCRILYDAIRGFETTILSIGGQLQKTAASTALDLFRRVFLKRDIATDDGVNRVSRIAYCGSRVEVFEQDCTQSDYYDVNSSFPYAMTFPCPGNLSRIGRNYKQGEIALVKATIKVPPMNIPPAPFRGEDKRIYFPTGTWNSWFSSVDLEAVEDYGGSIVKIEECKVFEPFTDLRDFAQTLFQYKEDADPNSADFMFWKILMNSLYGKFAEGSQKQKVVINPPPDFFKIPEREPGGLGREIYMPGVHCLVEEKDIPHAHVPISLHITSIARRVLGDYLRESPRVYYCDTDGFAVPDTMHYPCSKKLGGLKLEKHVYEAKFLAPKLYAYRKAGSDNWIVKGKGFSNVKDRVTGETHKINYDDFRKLIEHKDLHLEQFARLKTLWKSGDTTPREVDYEKTWVGQVRTKREMLPGGGSRAWDVKELMNG